MQCFDYVGSPERDGKLQFFKEIDVFSLPTVYQEPKGIPVLEALACGIPVVQPRHGAFPEMLAETGGGVLFEPGRAESLAESLADLLTDPDKCTKLGAEGRQPVVTNRSSRRMAEETLSVYDLYVRS